MMRRFAKTLLRVGIAAAFCCSPFLTGVVGGSEESGIQPHPSTSDPTSMLFVLMLSTFIGLGVITRVSRLLHTPLMSLTNAISAIAVVGAIVIVGGEGHPFLITVLGAVALFASITNIVSGFLITDRMLKMFKQREQPKS